MGATVRAVAEDPKLAQLFGIDPSCTYTGVFVFEAATVAFAATLVAPRSPILTSMGFDEVILTFVVVVLGGVGSVIGTLLASLGLGLFTAFFGALVSPPTPPPPPSRWSSPSSCSARAGFRGTMTPGSSRATWLRIAGGAAATVAAFYLPALAGGSALVYSTCVTIAIFAVMAYGTDLVLSYLGEVSLGHTIFWAGGGYVTALLATRLSWNAWLTALATVVFALALAFALGLATLRTREFVFSLVTYAAAVVATEIAFNWAFVGGSDGITGIPPLVLPLGFRTYVGGTSAELWPIALVLLLLTLAFVDRFRRSRLGLAALMVQMNPGLAMTLGLDTRRVRVMVFVVSAPLSALAGWLYAYQRAYVGPDMFESYFLVVMLTAAVLTGRRVLLGPVIGTAVILTQQNLLSVGGDGDKIILGAVLAGVLLFWPQGLVGLWRFARRAIVTRGQAVAAE